MQGNMRNRCKCLGGRGEFKNNPTAKVLEKSFINKVVTADSQQHKGMEDAESILNELRRMPKRSEETTAS